MTVYYGRSADQFFNDGSFAGIRADGSVVAWGNPNTGGELGGAAAALDGSVEVVEITSNAGAFAALLADGSVVAWGDDLRGGDTGPVSDELDASHSSIVVSVVALGNAVSFSSNRGNGFAAIRDDGSVVAWGARGEDTGGRIEREVDGDVFNQSGDAELSPVVELVATQQSLVQSFMALRDDGSIFSVSNFEQSEVLSIPQDGEPRAIGLYEYAPGYALFDDGSVRYIESGLDPVPSISTSQLAGVSDPEDVVLSSNEVAVLSTDGSITTFDRQSNDPISRVSAEQQATEIFANENSYAALLSDGSVTTWSTLDRSRDWDIEDAPRFEDLAFALNGDSSGRILDVIPGIGDSSPGLSSFSALREDGSVVTWEIGNDERDVFDQSDDIPVINFSIFSVEDDRFEKVVASGDRFMGLTESGQVFKWEMGLGDVVPVRETAFVEAMGGTDTFAVGSANDPFSPVSDIFVAGDSDFSILRADGDVILDTNLGDSLGTSATGVDIAHSAYEGLSIGDVLDDAGRPIDPEPSDDPVDPAPGDDDPVAPDPGEASPVDTAPLAISAPGGWTNDGSGRVINADGGDVLLGHTAGEAALLRVGNGRVEVSDVGRVTLIGDVYAVQGGAEQLLFTGSFGIEPGALSATGFSPQSGGYGLLDNLIDVDFSRLTFSESDVALGADLDFPAPFDAFDTSGGPLALRFGAEGLSFGAGRVGTSNWLPDIELPLSGGSLIDLTFSDLGVDYDGVSDSLYLSGEAALVWGGTIKKHFDGLAFVPLQDLTLDLAGERTGDALFERGEKFLRLQREDGELSWDIVGDITYTSTAGLLREVSLGLDTIDGTFEGSVTGALSFADDRTLTGALSGSLDPAAIDSLRFGVDGLNIPVASTGLFLQGGTIGVEGLAGSAGNEVLEGTIGLVQTASLREDAWLDTLNTGGPTYSGEVKYTYGSAAGGLPTPFRGDIGGSFDSESVNGSFSIRSTPGFILGDAASGGVTDTMERYFGVDAASVLDFDILNASGEIDANFANNSLNVGLEASVLGGLFSGRADLEMYEAAGVRNVKFGAQGQLQFPDEVPVIGGYGVDGNITVEYSGDGDLSNDYIAAWTTVDLGVWEGEAGLKVTFDGNFRRLNNDDIELIGSWELGPEMEVAVLSAEWEAAREDAELVVITPDGTRLSEDDIAVRDDIAIAPGLTTDTSRHVAIETPETGIWDIEMVAPDGLGEVIYSASNFRSGPTLDFAVAADDRETELADLTVTAQRMTAESEIIINALANRDDGAGVRLDVDALQAEDGTQTFEWDYSDFDPGTYYLEAVARGGGVAPEATVAEATVTVDALISGTVAGAGGSPLSGTDLSFTVDGDERAATQTDADGGFALRTPPDTAGQFTLERAVTPEDTAEIGVSDALETLRLAVGLEPSWGPADGADFVAADFDGDGSVSVSDALDILRQAVGLETGDSQPRWVFGDIAAEGADANSVPLLDNQVDIAALTADTQVNAQGILVGNMEDYV